MRLFSRDKEIHSSIGRKKDDSTKKSGEEKEKEKAKKREIAIRKSFQLTAKLEESAFNNTERIKKIK